MTETDDHTTSETSQMAHPVAPVTTPPQWKPLTANQRRVLGTLMEKSKTTPDAYPMSYSGLTTGCNQKNNRDPLSNFTVEQVETIVDELRTLGAVAIVQGSGRVTKVRHYAYNWMGLNKVEAAIITELLLRGAQTMGELRTRASRMEPIADLNTLQEIFEGLKNRNLVVTLTPAGRGQIVSHNLYPEWEIEKLRESQGPSESFGQNDTEPSPLSPPARSTGGCLTALEQEVQSLKSTVELLAARLERLEKDLGVS